MFFTATAPGTSAMDSPFVSQPQAPSFGAADGTSPPTFWETVPATTAAAQTPPLAAMAAAAADAFRANPSTTYASHDLFCLPSKPPAASVGDGSLPASSQPGNGPPPPFSMGCGTDLFSLPATTERLKFDYQPTPLASLTTTPQTDLYQTALQPSAQLPGASGNSLFQTPSPWGQYLFEPPYLGAMTGSGLPGAPTPGDGSLPVSSVPTGPNEHATRTPDQPFALWSGYNPASALDRADTGSPSETGPIRRAHRSAASSTLDGASGGSSGGRRSRAKGRFPCKFCGTVVSRMDSLTRHMKRKHPQQVKAAGGNIGLGPLGVPALTPSRSSSVSTASSPGAGLACSLCNMQLSRVDSLLRHLNVQHGQDISALQGFSPEESGAQDTYRHIH